MQLTISNPTVVNILGSLAGKLDLPIELVLELVIAHTDSDQVLVLGNQLSAEIKAEATH